MNNKSPRKSSIVALSSLPCGLEVSARTLRIEVGDEDFAVRSSQFTNNPAGHRELVRWLAGLGRRVHLCLEATGVYGLDAAVALHQAAVAVMVINPRAARNFAQALLKRSKNDRLDASVLRQFAARMPFQLWQPPSLATRRVLCLARRLEAVTTQLAQERNRLHAASAQVTPRFLRLEIQSAIRYLEQSRKRLLRAAEQFIVEDAVLLRRHQLLLSVRGIGRLSAVHLLAELCLMPPDLTVRQWVAWAGLDPREHSSGTSVHRKVRISKAGSVHLRRALYMPALVAVQRQPHFRAFYQHLLDRGAAKLKAIVAVMRKMLHAIHGMFEHDQQFDGSKVYALLSEPTAVHA